MRWTRTVNPGRGRRRSPQMFGAKKESDEMNVDDRIKAIKRNYPGRIPITARQRPGTPSGVLTCQNGRLDNGGPEPAESP
jgi:hypothetical protein